METIGTVWELSASKWDEVVSQIGDDDWDKETPCNDWTVRDLVDHTMLWQGRGAAVFAPDVDDDADWETVKPAMTAALADPANLEGDAESMGGAPKQAVAGLITTDLLIHSWDLARALDVDATLPDTAVESTLFGLQRLPEEMLRTERMFAAEVEVPDDANSQERLIAFVGRTP